MADSTEILDLLHQISGKVDRLAEESAIHTRILEEHSRILGEHSRILGEHSRILGEHGRVLGEHTRLIGTMQQDVLHIRTVQESHTHLLDSHTQLLNVHSATINILLQDVRTLRGAVIDVSKEVAKREVITPGQVVVLHEDLNRLHFQVSEMAVRLEVIEVQTRH